MTQHEKVSTEASEAAKTKAVIRGKVTYPYGAVAGASVAVGEVSGVTDGEGCYELKEIPEGENEATVKPPEGWKYKASSRHVKIEPGKDAVVDFYLERETGVLEGYVFDEQGKPITGAVVSGLLSAGFEPVTRTSDEKGYFRFESAVPGEHFVRAKAAGFTAEGMDAKAVEGETANLVFRLKRGAYRMYGRITDDKGMPLESEILLYKSGIVLMRTRSHQETGKYDFTDLQEGAYEVFASAPEHEGRGWHGVLKGDVEVNVTLPYVSAPLGEDEQFIHH